MPFKMSTLAGVAVNTAVALQEAGLDDSTRFLAATATPQARATLAARLGLPEPTVLLLANRADLARIRGIGKIYSDLLEHAGVDTVAELATRNPTHLYQKLVEMAADHAVQRLPRPGDVTTWVEQARTLEPALRY